MKKTEFLRLPIYEDDTDVRNLQVGDKFLMGESVIGQKESKKNGDSISYYQVIRKTKNGIEYTAIIDFMEGEEEI